MSVWPEEFATKKEAHQYLVAQGWQASQSNFYKHCSEGRLTPKNGIYRREAVDRYAESFLRRKDTGKRVADELEAMQKRKLDLELEYQAKRNEKLDHELSVATGKYIPREDVERELAGRAVVIKTGLHHLAQTMAGEWIELVGGDQGKAGELIAAIQDDFAQLLNRFASLDNFEVVVVDAP